MTLEGVLKKLTHKAERVRNIRSDFCSLMFLQAEEKAEINAQIIEEKQAAVKETEINNLEASANEDNMLERIR